jgi:hypothetical protein
MTAAAFNAWRLIANKGNNRPLSERDAADLLGCSRTAIRGWSTKGAPKYVALACSAILHGLPAWEQR